MKKILGLVMAAIIALGATVFADAGVGHKGMGRTAKSVAARKLARNKRKTATKKTKRHRKHRKVVRKGKKPTVNKTSTQQKPPQK